MSGITGKKEAFRLLCRAIGTLCLKTVFCKKTLLFRTNRGLSLVELITALGIFTILSSVSFVTFRKQTLKAELMNFVDTAKTVQTSFKNCLASSSWKVTPPGGTAVYPCSTLKKIGWKDEPIGIDEMKSVPNKNSDANTLENATYFCASFGMEAQGDKYQIHVYIHTDDLEVQVRCDKKMTTYHACSSTAVDTTNLTKDCSGQAKAAVKELLKP